MNRFGRTMCENEPMLSKTTSEWRDVDDKFAGPCAQGVLDPVIVPRPMSLGCTGWIDSIVLFEDNAFLGTSAHESVPHVGYSLDCRCGARPR